MPQEAATNASRGRYEYLKRATNTLRGAGVAFSNECENLAKSQFGPEYFDLVQVKPKCKLYLKRLLLSPCTFRDCYEYLRRRQIMPKVLQADLTEHPIASISLLLVPLGAATRTLKG
jgi:hypothetical protein